MNGSRAANAELLAGLNAAGPWDAAVAVCSPFPYLGDVALSLQGSRIQWGAQDCSAHESGAFTGEVSASMLAEFGCHFVILGHSERRAGHGEGNAAVAAKIDAAIAAGLRVILCCGESLETRDAGKAEVFVLEQLRAAFGHVEDAAERLTIAYEPIWAIGTGRTAEAADILAMHAAIRRLLTETYGAETASQVRILYGGSVKPDNAKEILGLANVDGALVGGASLSAESFLGIVHAAIGDEVA